MIEYIQAHQSGFWIATGFVLLAMEVLLFGFTTIIFMFAGVGAIITGLLMMVGVLDQTWISGLSSFGISTGIVSILLWKPLRKLQDNHTPANKQSSDFVGHEFVLKEDISLTHPGRYRFSGVDWKVEIDSTSVLDNLSAGERVKVVSLDAGVFRVAKT